MDISEKRAAKAAYMREYNARPQNREKKRAKDREYYQKNRDKIISNVQEWYKDNHLSVKQREAIRRYRLKAEAANLLGGKCERCGFEHLAALDFHHKDPTQKSFRLSDALVRTKQYSREMVEAEILKCELLCKNCHAIEHCTWELEGRTGGQ